MQKGAPHSSGARFAAVHHADQVDSDGSNKFAPSTQLIRWPLGQTSYNLLYFAFIGPALMEKCKYFIRPDKFSNFKG
jgi:hypothetical protein